MDLEKMGTEDKDKLFAFLLKQSGGLEKVQLEYSLSKKDAAFAPENTIGKILMAAEQDGWLAELKAMTAGQFADKLGRKSSRKKQTTVRRRWSAEEKLEIQNGCVAFIAENPDSQARAIAEAVKQDVRQIGTLLTEMHKAGLVAKTGERSKTRYSVP